jgi:hypothetical protein
VYTFIELPIFTKMSGDLLPEDELHALQRAIASNPHIGDVVPGTHGVRKMRWSQQAKGKRGGLRVIYYVQDAKGRIWLLTLYAKNERDNIAVKTLNELREFADHADID